VLDIKFSYIQQHEETGRITDSRLTLQQVEALTTGSVVYRGYTLVARRQFTGLLDKSGKEIYEGDIIKYSKYVDHGQWGETVDGGTVQVTWLAERAGFYPFYVWSSYNDQLKTCEVVGNIYENPELLTK